MENKLDCIQVLRAIAALLVAMNHYPGRLWFFSTSYIGVDLFFVISGFIMVITTDNHEINNKFALDFMIRRFSRVWPYYAAITIITFVLIYIPNSYDIKKDITLLIKSLLFVPMWTEQPIVNPGWTLSLEMYFYTIFFVSLFFGRHRYKFMFSYFALTLGFLYCYNAIDVSGLVAMNSIPVDYYIMITRQISWCFVLGMATGFIYLNGIKISSALSLFLSALSFSLAMYVSLQFKLDHGLIYGVLFAIMLYASTGVNIRKSPTCNVLIFLGNISFSFYIIQFMVIHLIESNFMFVFSTDWSKYAMIPAYLLAITIPSYLFYVALENPLYSLTKNIIRGIIFPVHKKRQTKEGL